MLNETVTVELNLHNLHVMLNELESINFSFLVESEESTNAIIDILSTLQEACDD